MTDRSRLPAVDGDAGFVLVGVVMFIMVLTILGLSLFSLSGFEAQFLNASLHRQESYYTATGGIERAKWVLMRTSELEKVKENMPEGVLFTTARQGTDFDSGDSLGNVDWDGDAGLPPAPVWIRVLADKRGIKSYIEARFDPTEPEQIYKHVVTSYTDLTTYDTYAEANAAANVTTRYTQVALNGTVWENSSDLTWQKINGTDGPVQTGGAQMPDVLGFYAAYLNAPGTLVAPAIKTGTLLEVFLNSGSPGGPPVFYRTPGFITNSVSGGVMGIHVRGTAVWMLPDGIDMRPRVVLHGTPSDRLIIVARRGGIPAKDVGISFDAIEPKGIPLIFVTDSGLEIKADWNYSSLSTNVPYISMFAKSVLLMGPSPGENLNLFHDSSLDDAVLEPLYEAQALPNTLNGATRTLTLQTGTWRQLPTTGLQ